VEVQTGLTVQMESARLPSLYFGSFDFGSNGKTSFYAFAWVFLRVQLFVFHLVRLVPVSLISRVCFRRNHRLRLYVRPYSTHFCTVASLGFSSPAGTELFGFSHFILAGLASRVGVAWIH